MLWTGTDGASSVSCLLCTVPLSEAMMDGTSNATLTLTVACPKRATSDVQHGHGEGVSGLMARRRGRRALSLARGAVESVPSELISTEIPALTFEALAQGFPACGLIPVLRRF
jgi:hypothetical protein